MANPFGGNPLYDPNYIPPAPKAPWEITHYGMPKPVTPGFAANLFSSGDPLEGGLLDPARAKGYGNRALLDAGLNILQHSGPAPFRTGLAQLLAGGVKAGQQSFLDSTKQGVAVDDIIKQREQAARLGVLRAKYAGKSDIQSQQQLLSELLTNGFTREADSLAGFLSNAINQQGRGTSGADVVTHASADGTQLIAVDRRTGKELWKQPLGAKPSGPTEYQQFMRTMAMQNFVARNEEQLSDNWRQMMAPVRTAAATISRALSLKDAALAGNGLARNQLLVSFVKAIDPMTAAREGEVDFAESMLAWKARLKGYVNAATGEVSHRIPEEMVNQVIQVLEDNMTWYRDNWDENRNEFINLAKRRNIPDPEGLFGTLPEGKASSKKSAAERARKLAQ